MLASKLIQERNLTMLASKLVQERNLTMLSISSIGNSRHYLIRISFFFLLAGLSIHAQSTQKPPKEYFQIMKSDFPNAFDFGSSTAAPQIEGSPKAGGRGSSIWDQYIREYPDNIMDKSNLDVAADSYIRYKEDVSILKVLGVNSYRFSISWTRILPDGTLSGGINQEGINHYNKVIDELIKNDIKPWVTIMHFDLPENLQNKYGGFLNQSIVNDFKDYAEICFKTFGDRVKNWITINEPLIMAQTGFAMGRGPPLRCSDRTRCKNGNAATEPYIVSHNVLLAHATAAKLYKQKYQATQGGQIGISHVAQYYEPYTNKPLDIDAAKRSIDFDLGWYMEPLVRGEYPESMRRLVKDRLPVFTAEEKALLKESFDFIGINYYTSRYAHDIPLPNVTQPSYLNDVNANQTVYSKQGYLIGPQEGGSTFIYRYPVGLRKILKFMKENYGQNLTIYITENGYTESASNSNQMNDQNRIEFIQEHLLQLHHAIKDGVDVKGYFYYSLIDSFEWGEGYTLNYGLCHVDSNLTRAPKASALWYREFIKGVNKIRA